MCHYRCILNAEVGICTETYNYYLSDHCTSVYNALSLLSSYTCSEELMVWYCNIFLFENIVVPVMYLWHYFPSV